MCAQRMRTVIFDNGTDRIKAGFGGQSIPHTELATRYSCPRPERFPPERFGSMPDYYIGYEGTMSGSLFRTEHPIRSGIIEDFDGMEKLWNTKELMIAPEDHPVLMTEGPLNPPPNREKTTEIMFEVFKTPSLYLEKQAVLSLYASGRDTGVVLDSGGGITHTVPIFNGRVIQDATLSLDVAGRLLSSYFTRMVWDEDLFSFVYDTAEEYPEVREMKEFLCQVSQDFERDMQLPSPTDFTMEMGSGDTVPNIGKLSFRCPELLFKPYLMNLEQIGIHEMLFKSVSKCDAEIQKDLYSNIILSGGSSLFPGLPERLEKELTILAPGIEIELTLPPEPQCSAWLGGSQISSSPTFTDISISKHEYEEVGAFIVNRKCQ